MKQKYFLIMGLLGIIVFISGCVKQTPPETAVTALLDNSFQLKINQTAFIESENLKIKFLNVTEDSRCPSDVVCVWGGQVTVVVNVLKNNKNRGDFNLTSRAAQGEMAIKNLERDSIKLIKVEPYPKTTPKIELSDYNIILIVFKI
ncbi:hypothetical protein HZC30_00060 [Candidatus Woesearchaeota archaeon]|nr:hypothetical protein [Candidatus Woesearchaeota archaeon]